MNNCSDKICTLQKSRSTVEKVLWIWHFYTFGIAISETTIDSIIQQLVFLIEFLKIMKDFFTLVVHTHIRYIYKNYSSNPLLNVCKEKQLPHAALVQINREKYFFVAKSCQHCIFSPVTLSNFQKQRLPFNFFLLAFCYVSWDITIFATTAFASGFRVGNRWYTMMSSFKVATPASCATSTNFR